MPALIADDPLRIPTLIAAWQPTSATTATRQPKCTTDRSQNSQAFQPTAGAFADHIGRTAASSILQRFMDYARAVHAERAATTYAEGEEGPLFRITPTYGGHITKGIFG
jgi:hypothetical protein